MRKSSTISFSSADLALLIGTYAHPRQRTNTLVLGVLEHFFIVRAEYKEPQSTPLFIKSVPI